MLEGNRELATIIKYMKAHWPSKVKPEWQVALEEYPAIFSKVIKDFTQDATKNSHLIRVAGLSGSGKTTQILPAVEAYCEKHQYSPVLVAARRFVDYHPHLQEIREFYGEENLRKNTDEFSTILMCMTLMELIRNGYDTILDVTLLDPEIEGLFLEALRSAHYEALFLMVAVSPVVTEHFLKGRAWRHTKETEAEFIRATAKALQFYAESAPNFHIILWSVYDEAPVYDGPISNCLKTFEEYSTKETLPAQDPDACREAKIKYLTK